MSSKGEIQGDVAAVGSVEAVADLTHREAAHQGPTLWASPVDGGDADLRILDCSVCGYAHVLPLPTETALKKLYTEDFYQKDKADYIARYVRDLAWWNAVFDDRFARFRSLAERAESVLDIGCGPGLFLARAPESWIRHGIEPSPVAALHAKNRTIGAGIFTGTLAEYVRDVIAPESPLTKDVVYDIVHAHEVLEHVIEPLEMLKAAYALMASDSILCVTVPNDFSRLQKIVMADKALIGLDGKPVLDAHGRQEYLYEPWWVSPKHHLNYFTQDSICRLIQRAGFEIVHVETSFPLELFLLMGDDYVGGTPLFDPEEMGRIIHAKRKRFESALRTHDPGLLKRLYHAFMQLGLGREVTVYARGGVVGAGSAVGSGGTP